MMNLDYSDLWAVFLIHWLWISSRGRLNLWLRHAPLDAANGACRVSETEWHNKIDGIFQSSHKVSPWSPLNISINVRAFVFFFFLFSLKVLLDRWRDTHHCLWDNCSSEHQELWQQGQRSIVSPSDGLLFLTNLTLTTVDKVRFLKLWSSRLISKQQLPVVLQPSLFSIWTAEFNTQYYVYLYCMYMHVYIYMHIYLSYPYIFIHIHMSATFL